MSFNQAGLPLDILEIILDEAVSFYYAGLKGWVKPVEKVL